MDQKNIHKMVESLGKKINDSIKGHITIIGILTGGEYLSRDLSEYLLKKGRDVKFFNIKIDKEKKKIIEGKEFFKKDNNTTFIFVDDAIWTSLTKDVAKKESEKLGIISKFAVLLDPNNQADFSLFN